MTYEELKQIVQKHCHLYYDVNRPELSDEEFDNLYNQLEKVEKAQGWCASDSPALRVGGEAGKVQHPHKLYSLNKVYDKAEIGSEFGVEVPKLDGTNLTLIFKEGKLQLALT